MKRLLTKNVIVISVLVLLLCVLTTAAVFLTGEGSELEPTQPETEKIALADFSVSDVISLEYGAGDTQIKLEKNGTVWVLSGYPERETDGKLITNMLSALTRIYAVRSVDQGKLSDFGLDKPMLCVKVLLSNGDEHDYEVGIQNSFNGYSYISWNENVYMFSDTLSSYFDKDIRDILSLGDRFPSSISQNTVMSLSVFRVDGEGVTYTDCVKMTDFLASLKLCFNFNELVLVDASDDELKRYGVDDKCGKICIFYNAPSDATPNLLVDATFTLLIGKSDDGSVYYVMGDSSNVYKTDDESVSKLFESLFSHSAVHENECVSKTEN